MAWPGSVHKACLDPTTIGDAAFRQGRHARSQTFLGSLKVAPDDEIQQGPMAGSILATIPALVSMGFGRRSVVRGPTLSPVK